jgi:hypothetical protein
VVEAATLNAQVALREIRQEASMVMPELVAKEVTTVTVREL